MFMSTSRNMVLTGIGLLVAAGLFVGLKTPPLLVEAVTITEAPMQVMIEEEGRTRVKDRYVISAPVTGYLRRIDLDIGDQVEAGQTLSELEPLRSDVLDPRSRAEAEARISAVRSALLGAEEQVVAAKANADYAQAEYQRKKSLQLKKAISEEALSQAQTEQRRTQAQLRSAKFAVDVARYELDAASTRLQYSAAQSSVGVLKEHVDITSPLHGSVLALSRKSEGVVQAGTALVEIGDPGALEVVVDVLSFDAVQIKKGMEVSLERWGGEPLSGVVRVVEPVGFTKVSALGVEEQRVWVVVDINAPSQAWLSLGDGYRVEARFMLWQADAAIQAPNSSLFRHDNQWFVYVIDDDSQARLRPVLIGQRNGLYAQVLEGLHVGELVIAHPDDELEDSTPVHIR
jgi:HlyD family secretion protein